tara:strand:+ start:7100 stop:7726 length:627 start_codon:yes stop_codon:yes gene_type:complete
MKKDIYIKKLEDTFLEDLLKISKPQILEFGVRHGQSTEMFIEICEKNDGFLHSVDIDNYENKFNSTKWKFIHGRDDNYQLVEKFIPKQIDLIYLDSFHNANHVEKIFYHYYPFIKENGFFIIDDTSWIIYSKNNVRDNFNSEINNYETFFRILDIYNSNIKNFDLSFNFIGSGMAKIKKITNNDLSKSKKIQIRKNTIKNILRKILRK